MKYQFKHPSFYGGNMYEAGQVYELDAKVALALGEDTVTPTEQPPVTSAAKVENEGETLPAKQDKMLKKGKKK